MTTSYIPGPILPLEAIGTPITSPIQEGPPDLIPGFLPRRGQLVIAGETEVGKTLVALEVCSSLVTGNMLWGELQPTAVAKKILYVLGEHYNEVIQRLWQKTRLPMSDDVWLLGPEQIGYDKWLVAQGRPNNIAIDKFRKWGEGADLIVFDPFSAFVTGIDVENDNVQMRLVLDTMSLIAQSVGASCIILAHQGKPMMDAKTGQEHARKSYAIRGASAIEDAATNIFYMGHMRGSSKAAENVGNDKVFELVKRKYKGHAPSSYNLRRDPTTLTHTLLGNRPFKDVERDEVQQMVARLQAAFDEMTFADAIKGVAAIRQCSPMSVRRALQIGAMTHDIEGGP